MQGCPQAPPAPQSVPVLGSAIGKPAQKANCILMASCSWLIHPVLGQLWWPEQIAPTLAVKFFKGNEHRVLNKAS